MKTKTLIVLTLTAFLAACELVGITDKNGADSQEGLVGTWRLTAFEKADRTETDVGSEDITLTFAAEDSLTGWSFRGRRPEASPANEYFGTYEAGPDGSLTISGPEGWEPGPFSTKVGLLPGSRYEEYLAALGDATSYKIEGNRLRINYGGGKALLFERERAEG